MANNAEKNIPGSLEAAIARLPIECQGCSAAQFAVATAWVYGNAARFQEAVDCAWLSCRQGDPKVAYADNRTAEGFEYENGERRIILTKGQLFPCGWLRAVLGGGEIGKQ